MSINNQVTLTHREGILLRGDSGSVGDLCPLPGYSIETMAQCLKALQDDVLLPSVEWALYCAKKTEPLKTTPPVKVALLLPAMTPLERLLEYTLEERRVVKAKVGRGDLSQECQWIASLLAHVGEVRLDGNRALSVEGTMALAEAAGEKLSFFEEPVQEHDLSVLYSKIPVGLDETLASATFKLDADLGADTYVVKPSHLGSTRTTSILHFCNRNNKRVVVSSLYESPYGHAHLCALAQEVGAEHAHGLGTQPFLEEFDESALEWNSIDALW